MAAVLLLALKAMAYHGEDNNWFVQVDGMIDNAKCLRVGSITDLGADEANSNTGDRTTPNSNVSCGFGDAGIAPMCALSQELGSGAAEGIAEAQAAIVQPATISGCVFDESSVPACQHMATTSSARTTWDTRFRAWAAPGTRERRKMPHPFRL